MTPLISCTPLGSANDFNNLGHKSPASAFQNAVLTKLDLMFVLTSQPTYTSLRKRRSKRAVRDLIGKACSAALGLAATPAVVRKSCNSPMI